MKNIFFLSCIILSQICFGQSDSLKEPLIDLTIYIKSQDTGEPINGVQVKISGSNGSERTFITDITGMARFAHDDSTNFVTPGNTYTITFEGVAKKYFGVHDEFSTVGVITNTRIVREIHILKTCTVGHPKNIPSLRIKGLLTEIDSSSQDSLDYLYMLMIEFPSMIISITSLFEHEKDITPFWRRSKTVQARLIEMGIPKERLIIKIETYSEQTDSIIRERKGGNVIFAIESFDYVPTPP